MEVRIAPVALRRLWRQHRKFLNFPGARAVNGQTPNASMRRRLIAVLGCRPPAATISAATVHLAPKSVRIPPVLPRPIRALAPLLHFFIGSAKRASRIFVHRVWKTG